MFQDSLLERRPPWLLRALTAIHRHEVLLVSQLALATGVPESTIADWAELATQERLVLQAEVTPFRGRGPALRLGAVGLLVLQQADLASPGRLPRRVAGRASLAHDLERNELGLVLEALDRKHMVRLDRWAVARSNLGVAAHIFERGTIRRIPLVADALALVLVAAKSEALLIECDMGSVQLDRMKEKYRGYLAWWRSGGPGRDFHLKSLRVLTLTSTETRLARLREAAEAVGDGQPLGLLWFSTFEAVSQSDPGKFLGPHFIRADEPGKRRTLFGA